MDIALTGWGMAGGGGGGGGAATVCLLLLRHVLRMENVVEGGKERKLTILGSTSFFKKIIRKAIDGGSGGAGY